jgi:hypothetical protein
VQPIDAPDETGGDHAPDRALESDELFCFSTDYPHWQFDGDAALPDGLSEPLRQKILS